MERQQHTTKHIDAQNTCKRERERDRETNEIDKLLYTNSDPKPRSCCNICFSVVVTITKHRIGNAGRCNINQNQ